MARPEYWWCNQTRCWQDEYPAGYVCAAQPKSAAGLKYRRKVGDVHKGDVILHYRSGSKRAVVAVSRALEDAHTGAVPVLGNRCWRKSHQHAGWYFRAEYFLLTPPVLRHEVIGALTALRIADGPTTRTGRIRYAYFMNCSASALRLVRQRYKGAATWPKWAR